MSPDIQSSILRTTNANAITHAARIQSLWSGYGEIVRVKLEGGDVDSLIVKHIRFNTDSPHPRGWNSDLGHQRKIKSYAVETHWYEQYAQSSSARLPKALAIHHFEEETVMLLEDLDLAGFSLRKSDLKWTEITSCIEWLAHFHASYLGVLPNGLWPIGTYWHLDTRPQELEALEDKALKEGAFAIDEKLNNCTYKTLVHGDAKLANFCFSRNGEVAAVDFQYVGGGCGMKDLAYFIGSVLNEDDCEALESQILDTYFEHLQRALPEPNRALEEEWRSLYPVAWADFHRFLKGWSPGHWKINSYSEKVTSRVIRQLQG